MRSMICKSVVISTLALSFVPFAAFAVDSAMPQDPAVTTPSSTPVPASMAPDAGMVADPTSDDMKGPAKRKTKSHKKAKKAKAPKKAAAAPAAPASVEPAPTAETGVAKDADKMVDSNEPQIDTIGD